MSLYEKMNFKGIIISPVTRPIEDWKWQERWDLKKKLGNTFSKYGNATCSYVSLSHESALYSYQDNYAIIDFKEKHEASRALRAIEDGSIDYNKTVLTAEPLEENYCPINELVDDCLFRIFEFLPIYERLKLGQVCKRWRIVSTPLWRESRRIDLREKLRENKKEEFVMKSGRNLKEIYCFDDYGLRPIKKSCRNLENVSIEFRKYTTINGIDRACIRYERATLLQFKNLKRLMLKIRDARYTYFSFLQHLPSSMLEIHLINDIKWPLYEYDNEAKKHDQNLERYGKKLIDLSKFVELKALTLEHYMLNDDSLIGIEKLKKLICLSLDSSTLSPGVIDKLKFFNNLKHLSLKRVWMDYDDAWLIIKRNKYLEYLGVPRMNEDKHNDMWLRVMELEHLRVLSYFDTPGKIRELGVSRSVEYLELYKVHISNRMIESLAEEAFPNLKVLKYYDWGYSSYFTGRIKNCVLARSNKNLLRYCGGERSEHYRHEPIPDWNSDNFEFCETLPQDDVKILRCYGWGGWYIEEDNSDESITKSTKSGRRRCTMSKLSNNLLSKIIDYLPIDDKINASKVCRRWGNILENNARDLLAKFNVRELSSHSNREKCFIHFGKYFKNVYYFSGCGPSILEKYCCNVESLVLDYQFRVCECTKKATYKICYDLKWFKSLLLVMKNLTRLMLKDVNVFTSNLFEQLPETMVEIHVFNKSEVFGVNRSKKVTKIEYGAFHIDLSKFSHLRALTLLGTDLPHERPCKYATEVTGVEKLELVYLCTSEDIFANGCERIGNMSKLKYLSIKHCCISNSNLVRLLEDNENLQYLDVEEITGEITDTLLKSILSLRHLKYLRLKKKDSTIEYSDPPADLDFINGLEHLELLDIENDLSLPREVVLNLIGSSPKLKAVNLPINGTFFGEDMLTFAESNVLKRHENCKMRVFFGMRGRQLMETSGLRPPHVVIDDVPSQEYFTLIKQSWRGWRIDEDGKIQKIIGELLQSIT